METYLIEALLAVALAASEALGLSKKYKSNSLLQALFGFAKLRWGKKKK